MQDRTRGQGKSGTGTEEGERETTPQTLDAFWAFFVLSVRGPCSLYRLRVSSDHQATGVMRCPTKEEVCWSSSPPTPRPCGPPLTTSGDSRVATVTTTSLIKVHFIAPPLTTKESSVERNEEEKGFCGVDRHNLQCGDGFRPYRPCCRPHQGVDTLSIVPINHYMVLRHGIAISQWHGNGW